MRYAAFVAAALMLVQPAHAEKTPEVDPRASLGVVQQWIYNYRAKPDYAHVPAAVRVLFHSQTFKEPENAGIYSALSRVRSARTRPRPSSSLPVSFPSGRKTNG
jgi:hypothetical protein